MLPLSKWERILKLHSQLLPQHLFLSNFFCTRKIPAAKFWIRAHCETRRVSECNLHKSLCKAVSLASNLIVTWHSSFEQYAKVWKFPKLKNKQRCPQTWASRSYTIIYLHAPLRPLLSGKALRKHNRTNLSSSWRIQDLLELKACFPSPHNEERKRDLLASCLRLSSSITYNMNKTGQSSARALFLVFSINSMI